MCSLARRSLIEGDERTLRRGTSTAGREAIILGAGDGPCAVLALGARDMSVATRSGAATPWTRLRYAMAPALRRRPQKPRRHMRDSGRRATGYQTGGCLTALAATKIMSSPPR